MAQRPVFSRHLVGFVKFPLALETKTGLLIRMPVHAQAYRIGGADLYPIVTKVTYHMGGSPFELEVPYIPGSSLKGRMRALLELATNQKFYTTDERIWQHVRNLSAMGVEEFLNDVFSRNLISELFGWAAANYHQIVESLKDASKTGKTRYNENDVVNAFRDYLATTRLLFSDFFPSKDYVERARPRSVSDFLEEKSENRIDRITSAADPREVVRVKPGVEFEGDIVMLLFNIDKGMVRKYLDTLVLGFELLENTYLGGSGSRGYGRVEFTRIGVEVYKVVAGSTEGRGPSLNVIGRKEFRRNAKKAVEQLKEALDEVERLILGVFGS